VRPAHVVVPGVQLPVHAPFSQAELTQVTPVPHWPSALHDCTPLLPLHCVWPGAHTPMHAPLLHVWFTHAVGEPQLPLVLHVSMPLFTHWSEPGVHATQTLFQHAGVPPEHVVCVCQ
jgi:hypothetical protein